MSNPLENRPIYLSPPEQEVKEMSLAVALRKVVDDLFSCKAIAEKVQGIEGDQQLERLVSQHKQILVEHLEETAWRGVDAFLAQLEHSQTQPERLLPPPPAQRDALDSRLDA